MRAPQVVLLLGQRDHQGVWRFLIHHDVFIGIPIQMSIQGGSILAHLEQALKAMTGGEKLGFTAFGPLDKPLFWPDGSKSILIVGQVVDTLGLTGEWVVLPDLIRRLPRDGNRLTFTKVFQLLSGAQEDNIQAVELTRALIAEWFPS